MKNILKTIFDFLKKIRFLILIIVLVGITLEIFISGKLPDGVILGSTIAWLVVMFLWKLEANFSFAAAVFFLVSSQIFVIFTKSGPLKNDSPAEKAALFFYIFFFVGIVKRFLEMKKSTGELIKVTDVLKIIVEQGEREEALDLIQKWSLEKQETALVKNNAVKFTFDTLFRISKIKIKYFLIKLVTLIKTIFLLVKRQIRHVILLFINWIIRETIKFFKEFFDFSSSPVLIYIKKRLRTIADLKIFNKISHKLWGGLFFQIIILYFVIERLIKELNFYRWFFGDSFIGQFKNRIIITLGLFWIVLIALTIIYLVVRTGLNRIILTNCRIKNKYSRFFINVFFVFFGLNLLKKPEPVFTNISFETQRKSSKWFVPLFFLLILYFGNRKIFLMARNKFEFYPYINRIDYTIASRYSQIIIIGHNFKGMPFVGSVKINENDQRVVSWSDEKIIIEIDPLLSSSGNMTVVNDYGFGKGIASNVFEFVYFDEAKASQEEQKRFWDTLKDVAQKKSDEYEDIFR